MSSLVAMPVFWGRYLTSLALLMIWIGFWYSDTISSLIEIWSRSATFAHGYLIFPISLWLIWRNRRLTLSKRPVVSKNFLLALAACGFVWIVGKILNANVLAQFSFIGLLISVVVTILGFDVTKTLIFPLGFLFFSVPFGEFLIPFLMEATADFTVMALRLSGIPVYREGLQFVIPSGNWSVVEACSGLRYLVASLTIGTLFAHLNFKSWRRRIFFICLSVLVPISANWLRAYLIVLLGHLSDNQIATGVDHLIYGWIFFGLVVTIMFVIGAKWADTSPTVVYKAMAPPDRSEKHNFLGVFTVLVATLIVLPRIVVLGADYKNFWVEKVNFVLYYK